MLRNNHQPGAYAQGEITHSSRTFSFARPHTRPITIQAPNLEALPNAIAHTQAAIEAQNQKATAITSRLHITGIMVLNEATGEYEPVHPVLTGIVNGVREAGRFLFEVAAGR